jgi:hypothetical protein
MKNYDEDHPAMTSDGFPVYDETRTTTIPPSAWYN